MNGRYIIIERLLCGIILSVMLLIGCNNTSDRNESASEVISSVQEESSMKESSSEVTSSIEESSTEISLVEKINGDVMSFEEASKQIEDETFTVELSFVFSESYNKYSGYYIDKQKDYEKIIELLKVYFKCFFEQKYWANYDFVDDSVMNKWEYMYQLVIRDGKEGLTIEELELLKEELEQQSSIELKSISYNDDENYYIEVWGNMRIHHMHLQKIDSQWCVVKHYVSDYYTYYSEEDAILGTEMRKEIVQKAREKNPLTEDLIQEGIIKAIDVGFTHRLSDEELEMLKPEIEGIYDEEWCENLLRVCMNEYDVNFNQPIFLVWYQLKEGYDTSLEELKEKAFNNEGGYRIVYYVPEEGWKAEEPVFMNLPDYNCKDEIRIGVKNCRDTWSPINEE